MESGFSRKDVAEATISDFRVLGESKFMESSLEQCIKAADAVPGNPLEAIGQDKTPVRVTKNVGTILLVEDEERLQRSIKTNSRKNGVYCPAGFSWRWSVTDS
jgi:hypothetical protein